METVVYTTETYDYRPQMVADEFAARYFQEPRKATEVKNNQFHLIDGQATYEIRVIPAVPFESPERYAVVRL